MGGMTVATGSELTGSAMVSPAQSTTYTLTAMNAAGSATAMTSVTVNPSMGARINTFDATPASIAPGEISTLTWSTDGADRVLVEAAGGGTISDSAMGTGSATVSPSATTIYNLTAFNTNGNAMGMATVTVVPIQPVISAFTASPNLVTAGSTTTLSWTTMMAAQVSVQRGMTTLATVTGTAAAMGSVSVPVPAGDTTYTLVATNPGAMATANVTVRGLNAPAINVFTAAPMTATDTTTVTFTWDVGDVTTLALTADGAPVPGFSGVTTSTVVNAAGNLSVVVDRTTAFELVATNLAGTSRQSRTVTINRPPLVDMEPNDDFMTAQAVPPGTTTLTGTIATGSDEDWYAVTVRAGSSIYVETSDGMGGCPFDTVISIFDTSGTGLLARNDDGGTGRCSLIDPRTNVAVRDLAAGTYYVRVESFSTNTGSYVVDLRVSGPACGNQIREVSTGEQCDDGNGISGDGCSNSCMLEAEQSYTGPAMAQRFSDPIDPLYDHDVVQLTVSSTTAYLAAETFTSSTGACSGADTLLTLYTQTATVVLGEDDADGESSCSRIDPAVDSWARLGPGTYWLVLREDGDDATVPNVDLSVELRDVNVCGNGVLESGEACDDGNAMMGDGCSPMCALEVSGTYVAPGQTSTITGSIATVGATDTFAITVNAAALVTVETFSDAATGSCSGIDTQITLNDSTGSFVSFDDDGGVSLCSSISGIYLDPGSYTLVVNDYDNDDTIPSYDIVFSSARSPARPTGTTMEMEPNDTRASAQASAIVNGFGWETFGSSFTANDTDYFSFTVPAGQTANVAAVTHSTLNDFNTCPTDTILYLEDSTGSVLTSGDDTGFGLCSRVSRSLSAGTYYLRVVQYSGSAAPSYLLSIILD